MSFVERCDRCGFEVVKFSRGVFDSGDIRPIFKSSSEYESKNENYCSKVCLWPVRPRMDYSNGRRTRQLSGL